jgi:diphthamide biosynthesis enzyme Dph1/Dph2-like protein
MMQYNLNIEKVINEINKRKSKLVLIQLPEGLKPKAKEIVDTIKNNTVTDVIIWQGSCYGACDIPENCSGLGVDLIIQWGHNEFRRIEGW